MKQLLAEIRPLFSDMRRNGAYVCLGFSLLDYIRASLCAGDYPPKCQWLIGNATFMLLLYMALRTKKGAPE